MLNKFLNSFRKLSADDFILELLKPTFYEIRVDSIYDKFDINLNEQDKDGNGYLHLCAKDNLTESMCWLINKKINLEIENKEKETALFIAAKNNNYDAVVELINSKVNLEHLNNKKRTALQEAILANSVNVIDILLKHTKSLGNVDIYGHNLLFNSIINSNETIISKIIKLENLDLNQKDKNGKSVLLQSNVINKNYVALELMELGAKPTEKDKNGKDFLFYISTRGIEAEILIDKAINLGCDINSVSTNGTTIIMQIIYALSSLDENEKQKRDSLLKLIKKFLEFDIDLNVENSKGETALYLASKLKDEQLVSLLLLDEKVDIDYQNKNKQTVVDQLVLLGIEYVSIIKLLINYGASTILRDLERRTCIEKLIDIILYIKSDKEIDESIVKKISSDGGYLTLFKEMLDTGKINLNILNSKGKPLFFDSIFYRNDSLFRLLKEYDLDLNLKDIDKNNILNNLMLDAVKTYSYDEKSYLGMLKRMLGLGVDVNERDKSGGTSVHKAIIESCEKTLKLMLESKGDVKAVDFNGRNLAHSCVWKGKTKHFAIVHSYDNNILNDADKFGILPINYAAFMGHRGLVVRMIDSGAFINNPNTKDKKMIKYLSQYNKNLVNLYKAEDTELNKKNVRMLIKNMKDEFRT